MEPELETAWERIPWPDHLDLPRGLVMTIALTENGGRVARRVVVVDAMRDATPGWIHAEVRLAEPGLLRGDDSVASGQAGRAGRANGPSTTGHTD